MLAPVPQIHARLNAARSPRRRVFFPIVAQWHQALHALPIAAALSRRPGTEVHVGMASAADCDAARDLTDRLGARDLRFHTLWPDPLAFAGAPKLLMLAGLAPRLRGFDAIVAPDRTSLLLRRMGVTAPMIHTDHGAGDRAVGYERRIGAFDYILLAGQKQEQRMLREGLTAPGRYAVVGYPKFDAAPAARGEARPLFRNAAPTVLYNPHFRDDLGSWPKLGREILKRFAGQDRCNLIFAPHVRMAADRGRWLERQVAPFRAAPNIRIDLGGRRCCDMTYTEAADIYLGDVSSQVYEFIRRPRPCLFLNAHGRDWAGDENYAHWALGPVTDHADDILGQVERARQSHRHYRAAQEDAFRQTFDLTDRSSSNRAADAIEAMLAGRALETPCLGPLPAPEAMRA
jgi:hypothetical protein